MSDILDRIIHRLPGEEEAKEEGTRVMTIRMPATLHKAIMEEAADRRTSGNKLAIAKLCIKGDILDKVVAAVKKEEDAKHSG